MKLYNALLLFLILIFGCSSHPNKDTVYSLYRKGLIEYNKGGYNDAIKYLTSALSIDKRMVKAYQKKVRSRSFELGDLVL